MTDIQFGYMTRSQHTRDEDMGECFADLIEQVRLLEKLGYSSFAKGNHYSSDPFFEFQQIPLLCRLMAEAPKMRLIAGIVLLSLHKPLEIAEYFATMDVMSGGKVVFGAALGYRNVEYKAFNIQKGTGVVRFEQNLEAIKRLWTEDKVSMKGEYFELDGASVSMPCVQEPHPPIWIGANADVAVDRAARLGDTWYISAHHRKDTLVRQVEFYKRCLDKYKKPFPNEWPLRREVFVAESREKAIELVRPYLGLKYSTYHAWGQSEPMPEGDTLGLDFDDLIENRFIFGTADEVAAEIVDYCNVLGTNHFITSCQWPGMPHSLVMEGIHRFAEDVMPRVRQGL
ncbi:LLM class flavin-dependent oxidoreductase [Alphaproteobacteria bacterium]|jgi:alkanesulfonate monooxygenase SsuD/methylene tetrahydromethanopterin reductase-like flavin-dependent oxidoreductase (luciferase family)|nr:LLM class flavin-dependent oxidoreductase [Alphaproteobacteria bacterium]